MKELLSAASRVGGATHLVAAVTSVLRHGPRYVIDICGFLDILELSVVIFTQKYTNGFFLLV